jgi:hypothetical protein
MKKFVALSTHAVDRAILRNTKFNGTNIRVSLDDILVGACVTTRRSIRRTAQDERILQGIAVANKIARCGVCKELKDHGLAMAAITKMTYGTWWTLPSQKVVARARTVAINATWGKKRALRCPEIVVALLSNPVRSDPASAIIYRNLCDTRRLLEKSSDRYQLFCNTLAQTGVLPNVQGPAHGLVSLLHGCGCEHEITKDGIYITNTFTGVKINMQKGSRAAFARFVHRAVQRQTLEDLKVRVHAIDPEGKPGRKDLLGITGCLDFHAIFAASAKSKVKQFCEKHQHIVEDGEDNQTRRKRFIRRKYKAQASKSKGLGTTVMQSLDRTTIFRSN